MRKPFRSGRASGPEHGTDSRNVAGVGELRAVAERLLETGAHYLEQGRDWLHAATRREREGGDDDGLGHEGNAFGGERRRWTPDRDSRGAYAPDEYSFRETGGNTGSRGHDYDDHRAHEFDRQADHLARRRSQPRGYGSETGRSPYRRHGGQDHGTLADPFLPGSYGFGGEGRAHSGGPAQSGRDQGGHWRGGTFHDASGRWEQAYRAQGQGSHRGRGPRGYMRADERILEDVNERLCDDPIVDATEVEVRCEQGTVTLDGRVPTRWMKHRAEDIADSVSGVRDVDNRIRVAAEEPAAQGDFDTSRSTAKRSADAGPAQTGQPAAAKSSEGGTRDATRGNESPGSEPPQQPQAPH